MQRTGRAGGRHANPQLAIAFVAMRENVADMDKLPRLANQLGAWEILVSNLVPHTPELEQEILYSRSLTRLRLPRLALGPRPQPAQARL